LVSGPERFTVEDLHELGALVSGAWTSAADRDWSVPAGTLDWTCLATADHAVDCVYAPAFGLASRRTDRYPDLGLQVLGERATPARLVESLGVATRVLAAVVGDADPDVRAVIFRRPDVTLGAPADFVPRAAVELILHAHDVCVGLGVAFEPPAPLARRLREHTRPWPMWTVVWHGLGTTDDPWGDLLAGSGRARPGHVTGAATPPNPVTPPAPATPPAD
jgi:hypothetical protein